MSRVACVRYGRGCAAALLLALSASAPAPAQTVTLDEGTFRITIRGRDAGTETFSIRQNGTGADAVIIARGRVALNGGETTSSTQLSGADALRPTAYELTATGADARTVVGHATGGRFSTRTVSPAGEDMREHRVGEGAVLAEEDIAHHHFFIARRVAVGASRVTLLVPGENRQIRATVRVTGTEAIQVGGQTVNARRISVQPEGGTERILWADAAHRVVRVEVPSRNYVAERTTLPN